MTPKVGAAATELIRAARVARLATVLPDGGPHVIPICPVLDGRAIVFATDPSQKVTNIRSDPRVALVFDEYTEDWNALRSVVVLGRATIHVDGPEWERGRALLYEKFPQYEPEAEIIAGRTLIASVMPERVVQAGV